MLITQPALICLRALFQVPVHPVASGAQVESRHRPAATSRALSDPPRIPVLSVASIDPIPRTTPLEEDHPQPELESAHGPLTVRERRARAAALRALALSRTRRFNGARDAFIEASRLDPHLDLTRIPMFWTLERAAHEAAIDAYYATGREAEATVLRAQVRTTFRPRSLPNQAQAATTSL